MDREANRDREKGAGKEERGGVKGEGEASYEYAHAHAHAYAPVRQCMWPSKSQDKIKMQRGDGKRRGGIGKVERGEGTEDIDCVTGLKCIVVA